MNIKKNKSADNSENLCPVNRKRIKSITATTDINSSLSPTCVLKSNQLQASASFLTQSRTSSLTAETFEEMGIGILDSEVSNSSSATSVMALAANSATDENSNEATPNLDAPKLCHHQRMNYHHHHHLQHHHYQHTLDTTLDSSIENDTNINESQQSTLAIINDQRCDINNNNGKSEMDNVDVFGTQSKKVAILGAGAGTKMSANLAVVGGLAGTAAAATTDPASNSSNNMSVRTVRSPLATVTCNSNNRKTTQQMLNLNSSNRQMAPHAVVGGGVGVTTITTAHTAARPYSPSMPSTSKQAALYKQQQHLQQEQQQAHHDRQQQQQKQQPPQTAAVLQLHELQPQQQQQINGRLAPDENFFLYRNQAAACCTFGNSGHDYFTKLLSDEIILQIFKWLPKKALIRCSYVCRRFNRCANDETLWTRLDLGGRSIRAGSMESILLRGIVILRLAQTEINSALFSTDFLQNKPKFESKLQFLDLSMATISKPALKLLLSRCHQLRKLSLEHVPLNDEICREIAKNRHLEALNVAMCAGLEAWSVRTLMEALKNLNSLNISWTSLSVDAVTSLVTNITPNIMRLNIAGCRKTMFDSHLASLVSRCGQLLELDLSDCTGLTSKAVGIICHSSMLEYLSLSRCYQIPASSYTELIGLPTLKYLDVFGILSDTALEMLQRNFPSLGINKFIHSSVARPTVGTRRTSIWGLRTRD